MLDKDHDDFYQAIHAEFYSVLYTKSVTSEIPNAVC